VGIADIILWEKGGIELKFRKDKEILIEIAFWIVLVLGSFGRWLQNTSNQEMLFFVALWISMLATTIYKSTKPKSAGILSDERTRRTSEKAAYYVLWVTIFSLFILGMLYSGFPEPEIDFIDVVFFGPLSLFALFALFAFYFNKKGDVQ
jgi:uncharacterized membrane protein